jgi:hypothetical protein
MPYITAQQREALEPALSDMAAQLQHARTSGEIPASGLDGALNYIITRLLHEAYGVKASPHYQDFNAAVGVLESVKLELYRRYVAPYEDGKIAENGDV